ncbi:hypothetical protein SAMN02745225_02204 [Ferrithrix thermotolerans DSM 19514]|jgi:hypothetical protein|uniref:DUF192 domain-containing protein n=1 Tax=Ferrithrix thermotolerans DSM 19514 TaxID=1121881 RepID=A0A1M4Y1H0_9ACTN|nr:hypothetical protein [Ferrithrix thermotolerans]SHE99518.1 hypothetical protein SAMN02745225_02204 [Ferrithrix thermotolerans DSM 19514]
MSWLLNSGLVLASAKRVNVVRGCLRIFLGTQDVVVTPALRSPILTNLRGSTILLVLDKDMRVISLGSLHPGRFMLIPTKAHWLVLAPSAVAGLWGVKVGDELQLVEGL